jgi:hypothetical protein
MNDAELVLIGLKSLCDVLAYAVALASVVDRFAARFVAERSRFRDVLRAVALNGKGNSVVHVVAIPPRRND